MMAPRPKMNIYGLDLPALTELVSTLGEARFRARQIMDAIYRQDLLDPLAWTTLSQKLREHLASEYEVVRPSITAHEHSKDGSLKVVLSLADNRMVEAVAMPVEGRMTFCISSQVGCAYGCAFCMTARMGFQRHLLAGEIVGQVAALMQETGTPHECYNVVFMGMGEPLHNLEPVLQAMRLLVDARAFGLGPRRITISTVGLPEGIDRLAEEASVPRLAVSIVCADEQLRHALMPATRRVALDKLADAIRRFGQGRRDLPTLEVVLLRGVNDLPSHANKLAAFARQAHAKINLIEFNPTPELPFTPSPESTIQHFLRVLSREGIGATVRRSRGKDIAGACGQLALRTKPG